MQLPFLSQKKNSWWVEIRTTIPQCTYYFGPFDSAKEAKNSQAGYIEDLVQEQARGITVKTKRCFPESLTIFENEADLNLA